MMEDILKKRLKESIGKTIKIVLKSNGFKYEGKLTNFDDKYVELLDFISGSYKIISVDDIENLEVKG